MTVTPIDRLFEHSEHVKARTRQVKFTAVLLAAVTFVFFGTGWLAAKIFQVLWFGLVFVAMAVAEGWQAARPPRNRQPG